MRPERCTVLIIDDSLEDRLACRRFLGRDPEIAYTCIEAATAAEGLALCRECHPDAVLLDYKLPEQNGLTVLSTLIAEHGPHAFALLMLTGADDRQLAVAAMKLGAHDYLVKGQHLDQQLSRAIAGAIEKAGLQRDLEQQRRALESSNAQLQQALATLANEQLLQQVTLSSIGDGLIATDARGCITFLNAEAERLTGWALAEALGQPLTLVFQIVSLDTRARVEDPAAKVLRMGTVVGPGNHTVLIARDGRETPIDDTGAPIRQADGTVHGMVLVFRDVTAREQHAAALRQSEARFSAAFRASTAAMLLTRARDGQIIDVNTSYERLFGYTRDELIGQTGAAVNIYTSPTQRAEIIRLLREQGSLRDLELTLRAKSGELRTVLSSLESFDLDGEPSFLGTMVDITERKRAERALQRSAERLQVLADASRAYAEVGTEYQALLDRIARTTAEVLGEGCSIRLLADGTQSMHFATLYDLDPEKLELLHAIEGESLLQITEPSLTARILHSGQPLLISVVDRPHGGAAAQPGYWSLTERLGIHSILGVPMRVHGQAIGVLIVYRYQPQQPPFDEDDLAFSQDLADRAALAIGNARLLSQLQAELAERANAEAALRESEERLRAVTNTAQVGLVIVDQEHRYRYANPAYADIFRLPTAEIVGQRVADVLAPVYESQIRPRLERAFGGERVSYELVVPPAMSGAEERYYAVTYQQGRYRSSLVVVVVVVDVTEGKQADQQLRYQADLLGQVSDAIISTDAGFTIKSWNAAAERLYGWPAEEAIGLSMVAVVPTSFPNADAQQSRTSLSERGRWQGEVVQLHRDGSARTILSSVSLLSDTAGAPAGAVAVNRDITERKRAEQAFHRAAERLRVLADASRAFAEAGTDSQALLGQIARATTAVLSGACTISLVSEEGQHLQVAVHYDLNLDKLEFNLHMDEPSLSARIIQSGTALLVPVVDWEQLRMLIKPELWSILSGRGVHSLLGVPMRLQGRAIGVINLFRHQPEQPAFDTDDLTLIQDLADRAALAIGNARLFGQVQHELAERARAQAALAESEQNLRVVTETAGIGLALVDADHRYRYTNQTYNAFLRLPAEDVIGRRVADVFGPLYDQLVRGRLERAFAGESINEYLDLPVSPDTLRHCEVRLKRGEYRAEQVVVVVLTDITERKRAEVALQRSADRLQHLRAIDQSMLAGHSLAEIAAAAVTHIGHLIPTTRVGVTLIDLNAQTMTVLALQTRGVIHVPSNNQVPLAIFGAVAESLARGQLYQVADVAALPEPPAFIQIGQAAEVRAYFHMPILAAGELIALLNVGSDQPGAFAAEQIEIAREVADQLSVAIQQARLRTEVERYAQELEQRVADRTAELSAANKELEAFSYSISHDLRAPLRAIDGFSRILLEDYVAALPDVAQQYFQLVRNGAQQMGHLIDDLLAFSRLSRQPLDRRIVDSAALVRQCMNDLWAEQAGRRIDLQIGELHNCQADPALLKQVWVNLLSNALKYTGRRAVAEITIFSRAEGGEVVYVIKDNGVGFDMRYSDKLFGVFQRMHRAEDYEGTGVGLAIVQRIVHRHGGRIWAEAAIDQGATFYFTL